MSDIDRKTTCGHNGVEWNERGECITCARDRVLGEYAPSSDIDRKLDELKKAFGGCTNCYGKGYATWRHGEFYRGQNHNLRNDIKFCDCDRGNALLALINEAKEENRMKAYHRGYVQGRFDQHIETVHPPAELKPDTTLEGGK